MDHVRAARWKIEAVIALCAIGALVTVIFPQWLEGFGFEPDGGDGSAEWAIVVALGAVALASAALSWSHYLSCRRQRSIGEGARP
jgi:hypothetical protein